MIFDKFLAWIGMSLVWAFNHFSTRGFVFVEIDKGILRGRDVGTWRGSGYFSFKGIPYARPPLDDLRFKAPQEDITPWVGVRDAVFHGEVCPHFDMAFGIFRGQEDCLFLNVYTPSLEVENLPVMVFIHGGMFLLGSGNDEIYGPDYFMESGVVLVTINYRLGALGFLSTEDDRAPGNAGLKDQVAALRWIRRNIAKFGGDPENVTIFGGSTGAACVEYHVFSPMSKGLFTKAIAQSGSALHAWALSENSAEATLRLAEALGAKDVAGDMDKALEFLKTAPYEDIVRMQGSIITAEERSNRIAFLFAPTVEKNVKSEEVFLPDTPMKILESGNFSKVPYIVGYTSQEGYFFMNELEQPAMMKAAFEAPEHHIPADITDKRIRKHLAKSIRKFYFDDKPIGYENISNLVDLYSDTTWVTGIRRVTRLFAESSNSPTYLYVFSHDDKMNLLKFFLSINRPGAVHGDELGYLFHHGMLFWRTAVNGSTNQHMVQTMTRLWTNFAKYGNPTPPGDPLDWKPVTIDKSNYLNISGWDTTVGENPHPERNHFWEKAYELKASSPQVELCSIRACWQYEKNVTLT